MYGIRPEIGSGVENYNQSEMEKEVKYTQLRPRSRTAFHSSTEALMLMWIGSAFSWNSFRWILWGKKSNVFKV